MSKTTLIILIGMLLALPLAAAAPSITPIACDGSEAGADIFSEGDTVCVYGTGFAPGQIVDIYVVDDQDTYTIGQELIDQTEAVETHAANDRGILTIKKVWNHFIDGIYDFIVDLNRNGNVDDGDVINAADRLVDNSTDDGDDDDGEDQEPLDDVPEFSTIMAALVLAGAGIYIMRKRKEVEA